MPEASGRDGIATPKDMSDVNTLVEQISGLSLLQTSELVKALESKLGVSAVSGCGCGVAPAAGGGAAAAAPAEEKTALTSSSPKRAPTRSASSRKCARRWPGSAWPKPRPFVEGAPKTLKEGVTKAEADEIKKKISSGFYAKVDQVIQSLSLRLAGPNPAYRRTLNVRGRLRFQALEAVFGPTAGRHLTSQIVKLVFVFHEWCGAAKARRIIFRRLIPSVGEHEPSRAQHCSPMAERLYFG